MQHTDARLAKLYDAVEIGAIPLADLAPRIHDLKSRKDRLQERKAYLETLLSQRRIELAGPDIVAHYVNDLRNLLAQSELSERKAFVRSFVKEIRVTGDTVTLKYTMPLSADGVLSTVQYGGRYRT